MRCRFADCLRLAQGNDIGLYREWALDAKALLLCANLDIEQVAVQAVRYSPEFLEKQRSGILFDVEESVL